MVDVIILRHHAEVVKIPVHRLHLFGLVHGIQMGVDLLCEPPRNRCHAHAPGRVHNIERVGVGLTLISEIVRQQPGDMHHPLAGGGLGAFLHSHIYYVTI